MSDSESSTLSPEPPRRTVKIIFFSDYICAFCYIGNKVLQDAIKACADLPLRFDVEFRPFALMCSLPCGTSIKRTEFLEKKFGKESVDVKMQYVETLAGQVGLKIAPDGIVCKPVHAHRLAVKAYMRGGQELQTKFVEKVFETVFRDAKDISQREVLIDMALEAGVMENKEEAEKFLDSMEHVECVKKMMEAARSSGVVGVPFIIIDGKWALNGVQPAECYVKLFRKLAEHHENGTALSPPCASNEPCSKAIEKAPQAIAS